MTHEETFHQWTMQLKEINNYQPDRQMCDRFQNLGLSLAESMILTAQLEKEEIWDINTSLELMTCHPEAIKLDVLAEAIAYRRQLKTKKG